MCEVGALHSSERRAGSSHFPFLQGLRLRDPGAISGSTLLADAGRAGADIGGPAVASETSAKI
jgi:hypothetical protein